MSKSLENQTFIPVNKPLLNGNEKVATERSNIIKFFNKISSPKKIHELTLLE